MYLGNMDPESWNVPTDQDIHREQIRQLGAQRPDSAWILSDYDAWERNPYYSGPEVPHPEDDRNEPDTNEPSKSI